MSFPRSRMWLIGLPAAVTILGGGVGIALATTSHQGTRTGEQSRSYRQPGMATPTPIPTSPGSPVTSPAPAPVATPSASRAPGFSEGAQPAGPQPVVSPAPVPSAARPTASASPAPSCEPTPS